MINQTTSLFDALNEIHRRPDAIATTFTVLNGRFSFLTLRVRATAHDANDNDSE